MNSLISPLQSQVVSIERQPGESFPAGELLMVLSAMKMEHELCADRAGTVEAIGVATGDWVDAGDVLLTWRPLDENLQVSETPPEHVVNTAVEAFTAPRADLARLQARQALLADAARPHAQAKRHAQGQIMAREAISLLCDPGFVEYGAFAIAAQSRRRSLQDLTENTPADGMVVGLGSVNGRHFSAERAKVVVMAYDATVLAGTQGARNHQKTDRMLGIALQEKRPVVLFAEGGGGRPGDVDMPVIAGLHVGSFASFARLNGQVPVVGVVSGRCFAGNAALLGCCDVVIATRNSSIGMGGPAMVEGGGLGVFKPEEIGPSEVQHHNGVIDVLVDSDQAAIDAAKQYLSYFQGSLAQWQAPDAQALRQVVPENRVRVYDSRTALEGLADVGSILYLREGFGLGIHTALARLEGRPVGFLINNPLHLGGAIDADAADKAARFMQLCNAHGVPLVSLVDTPGFMVGPTTEATAQVRHVSRLFVASAHLRVPLVSIVLRKGYGLGAMAMTGGGFHVPVATAAWPSAQFGAMGIEGAVRLGYRKELEAQPDGPQRQALYDQLVEEQYAKGDALSMATTLEIDQVLDPADSRAFLTGVLACTHVRPPHGGLMIDTW
jgi:acetyl-CoA carboxylase carboxyltransferase component